MKKCKKCGEFKDFSEFNIKKSSKDGLYPYCKKCRAELSREYNIKNKERRKIWRMEYRKKNKERIRLNNNKKYTEAYKKKLSIEKKIYYAKNKEKIIKQHMIYEKEKMKKDPEFKLSKMLRHRLNMALNGNFKRGSAIRDLGCSIKELKIYLESKFYPHPKTGERMTWENHGKWHIDHVIPLSSFNLLEEDQLKSACNFKNLQPLWAEENLKKGNKIK